MSGPEKNSRTIFVGGLTSGTTTEMLRSFYEKYGKVVDCFVIRDHVTKLSRRFGFVTFERPSLIDACLAGTPHNIDGRVVDPKRHEWKDSSFAKRCATEYPVSQRIFVGYITENHTESVLKSYFQTFGEVDHVSIFRIRSHRFGYGYVQFQHCESATHACMQQFHIIAGQRCQINRARPKLWLAEENHVAAHNDSAGPQNNYNHQFSEKIASGPFEKNNSATSTVGSNHFVDRTLQSPPGSDSNHNKPAKWKIVDNSVLNVGNAESQDGVSSVAAETNVDVMFKTLVQKYAGTDLPKARDPHPEKRQLCETLFASIDKCRELVSKATENAIADRILDAGAAGRMRMIVNKLESIKFQLANELQMPLKAESASAYE